MKPAKAILTSWSIFIMTFAEYDKAGVPHGFMTDIITTIKPVPHENSKVFRNLLARWLSGMVIKIEH